MRVRHIYLASDSGKRQAIANLQFALEDSRPWYLSCQFKAQGADLFHFNNWVTRETFDEACRAIRLASKDIRFYQGLES